MTLGQKSASGRCALDVPAPLTDMKSASGYLRVADHPANRASVEEICEDDIGIVQNATMATVTTRNATPRPMGILSSIAVFGSFSLVLWLVLAVLIPWLHNTFGIPPIIGWYVSGTAFVLFPILLF